MDVALFDPLDLVAADRFAARGYPHDVWTRLRQESPVHWCEPDGYRPFWAITRQADIRAISSNPDLFSSAKRQQLMSIELEEQIALLSPDAADHGGVPLKMLVNMDPPAHRSYRNVAAPWFRPSVLRRLEDRLAEVCALWLDRFVGDDVELDFVTDIAARHPLRILTQILGVASSDENQLLRLTNAVFGFDDPEFAPAVQGVQLMELVIYMNQLIDEKQANPLDDLASVLANASVDGDPMPHGDIVSYLILVATAGHDTTRNALSGGLLALLEHPDQLGALRGDPALARTAADEIVRWTSPVIHFIRTANADTEVGGVPIRRGDSLVLFYPSGNRDEAVYDDPFTFRVDRDPNPHLGFGVGEHYCLGANLARMEIRVMFEQLVPRLRDVELVGEPQRTAANFVAGPKHLPIRWSLA